MKVVLELSGGADSAAAAFVAQKKYDGAEFHSIFVDYGQACARQEERASKNIHCALLGWRPGFWHSVFIRGAVRMTGGVGLSEIYMPLRNVVLTAAACSLADALGARVVVTGSKGFCKVPSDPYSFKDSTLPFYKLMEAAVNYAQEGSEKVAIDMILAEGRTEKMHKVEVYDLLWEHGFRYKDIWNCYSPKEDGGECGVCRNCIEKNVYLRTREIPKPQTEKVNG